MYFSMRNSLIFSVKKKKNKQIFIKFFFLLVNSQTPLHTFAYNLKLMTALFAQANKTYITH